MSLVRGVLIVLGVVFLLIIWGLFAVFNDDDDNNGSHSFGPIEFVSYRGGSDCYQYGDCDDGGDYDGNAYRHDYSNHDRNRNRNRDRGAFSPGPFRDSPVVICAPYSCNSGGEQSGGNRQDNPPADGGE